MIQTTLAKLKKHNPCKTDWKQLLKNLGGIQEYGEDTPLTLLQILNFNGLDDALSALYACGDKRFNRLLACDYVEHVLPVFEARYPDASRLRKAIEVSRKFYQGQATAADLTAACAAAQVAPTVGAISFFAWTIAQADALDAATTARAIARRIAGAIAGAAWDAARVAWNTEQQWQEQRLRELLAVED